MILGGVILIVAMIQWNAHYIRGGTDEVSLADIIGTLIGAITLSIGYIQD